MRFLKTKIFLAQQYKKRKDALEKQVSSTSSLFTVSQSSSPKSSVSDKSKRSNPSTVNIITPEKIRCTKNISKNYGSAIATFAYSPLSRPYLEPILKEFALSIDDFIRYAKLCKKNICGIDTFRNALLVKKSDSNTLAACKRVFQKIAEIFIKYFSVNWIFTAKILHKQVYLKYRGKMIRRIQNPELFTYLKN